MPEVRNAVVAVVVVMLPLGTSAELLPSSETSGPCHGVFLISRSGEGEAKADATSESTRLLYAVQSVLKSPSSPVSVSAHDALVDIAGKSGGVVHGNVHGGL